MNRRLNRLCLRRSFIDDAKQPYRGLTLTTTFDSAPTMATPSARSSATYLMAREVFVRSVGAIFLIAFASLWTQLDGLIGSRGISPAAEYLSGVREHLGWEAFLRVPTLCWISAGDHALQGLCGLGLVVSVLLVFGVATRWALLCLWVLYLSLVSVGDVFLQFQWDNLLLETSFFAIFAASPRLWPGRSQPPPSPLALWLLRWLLFRLMFLSGAVKLLSGDAAWRDLTALRFHYWTQPLPTLASYYANLLPNAFQTASAVVMFAIELLVPFLIFGPRAARRLAAAALVFLQVAIAVTGNYGFFNLLTLALCVLLVDDEIFSRVIPARLARHAVSAAAAPVQRRGLRAASAVVSAFLVLVSIAEMRFWRRSLPAPIEDLLGALQPFRTINSYGLFAVMTTTRPEIIVEGSADGRSWRSYEFRWKPGALDRAPRWVAPHQPRLDWQMWFAALGSCVRNPWFIRFQQRLLEGTSEVVGLLEGDPFLSSPPRYVRSTLYQYRFSDWTERGRSGAFWIRTPVRPYCPILSLEAGRLIAVSARSLEEQ
jgi:hypothetical protein